jgi:hypothetical protein
LETGAISTASPASHSRVQPSFPRDTRMGRKSRLLAHSLPSLDSRVAGPEVEITESLRPRPRIFPFWGDYRRRLVRSLLPPEVGRTIFWSLAEKEMPQNGASTSLRNHPETQCKTSPCDQGQGVGSVESPLSLRAVAKYHRFSQSSGSVVGGSKDCTEVRSIRRENFL